MTFLTLILIILFVAVATYIFFQTAPQIGGIATGTRLERMKEASNFQNGKFQNLVETPMEFPGISAMIDFFKGGKNREPDSTLVTVPFDKEQFKSGMKYDGAKMAWFGHSSILLRLSGKNILIDPVFSERASMFSFMGPERYDYSQHVGVADLPSIDCVVISHDHYDHLDYETFKALKGKTNKFLVPLGVGAHLAAWGIEEHHIYEHNWWESHALDDSIKLTFVPSRHFSGRAIRDRFNTLWGAWVIKGGGKNIFFGGDSGYFKGFKEIGDRLGPFDFAMLECGQYSVNWPDIHMMPEQTAQAGDDLQAKSVMPIHWGKFTLSLHAWQEPVERFIAASEDKSFSVVTPKLGEIIALDSVPHHLWWK